MCGELYRWIRATGGSSGLRTLFYMDEVGGGEGRHAFYPSAPFDPPSKGPLALLVKQGRSAGLGVLLATQNPVSVDVRALGNIGTWAVGQLSRKNDQERVRPVLEEYGARRATEQLARVPPGVFLVAAPSMRSPTWVHERWLSSVHRTLAPEQVRQVWRWSQRPHDLQAPVPATAPPPVAPPDPSRTAFDAEPSRVETGFTEPTSPYQADEQTQTTRYLPDGRWQVEAQGQTLGLEEGLPLTLGRSRRCDVVLDDPYVSSQHVRLEVKAGSLMVTPLRTKNPPRHGGDGRLEPR